MNTFEKNLLNKLLDKYESSKLSKGGTAFSRRIKLTTKDDVLSTYTVSDSYKYADENDAIIKRLEAKGFIKAEWNYDTFKSLTLINFKGSKGSILKCLSIGILYPPFKYINVISIKNGE